MMETHPESSQRERKKAVHFDVDGMLGGLEKWLRILGFDASFPRTSPKPGRLFVTKRSSAEGPEIVTVTAQRPLDQLIQVLEQADITPDPQLLLTRCVDCNLPVEETPKEGVKEEVPEYIYETTPAFTRCPQCGKVFWEGSHRGRIIKRLRDAGFSLE